MPFKKQSITANRAKHMKERVMADPSLKLSELAAGFGINSRAAGKLFQRHFGEPFSAVVRRLQIDFVIRNQGLENSELARHLKVSNATVGRLVNELEKKGRIHISRQQAAYNAKPTGFYKPSMHTILQLIRWFPSDKLLSANEIRKYTGYNRVTINEALVEFERQKLVSSVVASDGRFRRYKRYALLPAGREWLNGMRKERGRRDKAAWKTQEGRKSILGRKKRELKLLDRVLKRLDVGALMRDTAEIWAQRTVVEIEINRLNELISGGK
jgi:DNA-binding MarR family transcriptional regulator